MLSPEEKAERRVRGRAKAEAALERLDAAVGRIIESDDAFREYLRVSGRMHNYSWANRLLVAMQRPDAGMVAGFAAWKRLERPVVKGAKGIQILAPMVRKVDGGEENAGLSTLDGDVDQDGKVAKVIGYRVAYVFSIHDTDGPPVAIPQPVPLTDDGQEARDILGVLIARAEQLGVPVAFVAEADDPLLAGGAHGYYHPGETRIVVRADMPAAGRAQVLAHELAHHVAGKQGRRDAETTAEGAAFVVMAFYGLDTEGASAPYIAGWAQDVGRVRALLDSIAKVAAEITGGNDH